MVRPPSFTLCPYTTLFRSECQSEEEGKDQAGWRATRTGHRRTLSSTSISDPCLGAPPILCQPAPAVARSEEHTSELQSRRELVCRLLLEKKQIHVIICTGA